MDISPMRHTSEAATFSARHFLAIRDEASRDMSRQMLLRDTLRAIDEMMIEELMIFRQSLA